MTDSKWSLKDVIEAAFRDHLRSVHGDVDTARVLAENATEDSKQYHRRAYVRALFASVEAQLSAQRTMILRVADQGRLILSGAERSVLEGARVYQLSEDGVPIEGPPSRQPCRHKWLFIWRLYSRLHGSELTNLRQDAGWSDFVKAHRIRHRLTHPESAESATVSDADMDTADKARAWLGDVGRRALEPLLRDFESKNPTVAAQIRALEAKEPPDKKR
jgi:hypothetical protein